MVFGREDFKYSFALLIVGEKFDTGRELPARFRFP